MTSTRTETLHARLLELRQSFDSAFSEPIQLEDDGALDLLVIRVNRERFALRLGEIAALEADRTVTSVPSDHSELIGIAGVRGAVVAVFDLASLLDLPRPDAARWIVLAKGAPVAFAFSGFEGQRTVTPEALAHREAAHASKARAELRAVVRLETGGKDAAVLPLIDIPALIQGLDRRPRARGEHVV